MQGLEVGQRAHGYVTGVKDYGVFIAFCGGVTGLAPQAELGLEPNQEAATYLPVGKVASESFDIPFFNSGSVPQPYRQKKIVFRDPSHSM
jgi:hypothetical protein